MGSDMDPKMRGGYWEGQAATWNVTRWGLFPLDQADAFMRLE